MQIDKQLRYTVNGYTYENFINLSEKQTETILEWRNHVDIRRYMYNPDSISLLEHKRFICSLLEREDVFYWLVYKKERVVGVVNLTDVHVEDSTAELGYYIVPDLLNSGIGLDFAYSNFCFAFDSIGCSKLIGGIHSANRNALLLDKYLGCVMKDIKTLNNDGRLQEFVTWEITKEHFDNVSKGKNDIRTFVAYLKNNCNATLF